MGDAFDRHAAAYATKLGAYLKALPFDDIAQAAELLSAALDGGRSVFVFGNGGGATTASHFACDLGKGASLGRKKRFRVRSLGENRAWTTALANDEGFETVFVEELRTVLTADDVCVALSGSGQSKNVLEAVRFARSQGASVVGVCGDNGGALAGLSSVSIVLPATHPGLVEDLQSVVCHILGYGFIDSAR